MQERSILSVKDFRRILVEKGFASFTYADEIIAEMINRLDAITHLSNIKVKQERAERKPVNTSTADSQPSLPTDSKKGEKEVG